MTQTTHTDHALGMLEFSCTDVATMASFWSTILRVPVDAGATADYAQLTPPEPLPKWLFLRRQPSGSTAGLLIALTSHDLQASTDAAVTAGATALGIHELDGFRWSDLTDPEGNRFTVRVWAPGRPRHKNAGRPRWTGMCSPGR